MSTIIDRPRVYDNVQGARALAALVVVAYHLGVLPFGQCGVDIFFVISGFIMSLVAPGEGRDFLRKRLIRILPLYWLSTIGVYIIATIRPHWLNTTTADAIYLVKSLLFIPYVKDNGHWGPLNLNGWTLEYELLFYLVIAVAISVVRPRFAMAVAAAALALYSLLNALVKPSNLIVDYLGQPFLLEFCLGVLAYWTVQLARVERISRWFWLVSAVASLAAMPAYFMLYGAPSGFMRTAVYGVPAFAFITSLIAMETGGWSTRSRLVARLGAASYAIYLLHPYVVGFLRKVLTMQTNLNSWNGAATVFIVIAVVCAASDVCHRRIEKPVLAWLNRWFGRREPLGVTIR
ncbi:acyltransferase family protein [Paraburkholderia terricola]|uniref:acyltransferase family protein n=1 Tax=Paraburkholderia terricola TaxID=169427 RepID=UPI001FD52D1E|nr:acyltransferase [Paraburkholderia terricola]